MKLTGTKPRPWVKLWREERGLFAQLPLFARALDRELHVICDDDGVIDTGDRPHADAVAYALGADRGDRRLLKRFLPMLEAAGRVRLEPGRIVLLAWGSEQSKARPTGADAATVEQRSGNEVATTEQRPRNDAATNEPRPRNENAPKCAEPHETAPADKEEDKEKEQEERETERSRARARPPEHARSPVEEASRRAPALPLPPHVVEVEAARDLVDRARELLTVGYAKRYEAAVGDVWMSASKSYQDILACARWAAAKGPAELEARVEKLLDGVFADERLTEARWSWAWIAKDPARYATPPKRARRGRAAGYIALPPTPAELAAAERVDAQGDLDIPIEPARKRRVLGYG